MPFVKLWDSILDNVKVQRLNATIFMAWINLLAVTARYGGESGELPSWEDMAFGLRASKTTIKGWIDVLVTAGLIDKTKRHYSLHDFEKWNDSRDKTAAKRQREWRQRQALRNAQRNAVTEAQHNPRNSCAEEYEENEEYEEEEEGKNSPPPPVARSAEDQSQFDAAIESLRGSQITEPVAIELSRRSTLSEIRAIPGWKWLNAARVMGGGAKAYTVEFLRGIALGTTREEFEAYGKQPSGGKFARKETGAKAPDSSDRPWEDPKYLANAEKSRKELADIKARKEANGHL